jgi:hypothetical protein
MSSGVNLKAACLKHLRIAQYKASNSARPQYALVRSVQVKLGERLVVHALHAHRPSRRSSAFRRL